MPTFTYEKWRDRKAQAFNPDEIFIEKCGKKINVFQMIQENRPDTEVYETLEKYGCLDRMTMDTKGVYADFTELQKMGNNPYEIQLKADKLWDSLPLEVRQEFNHNKSDFMKNGENWLKQKIEQEKEPEIQPEQPKESE